MGIAFLYMEQELVWRRMKKDQCNREDIQVGWVKPHQPFVKSNCDGARKERSEQASAGCVGRWKVGATRLLCSCSIEQAKLWVLSRPKTCLESRL